MLFLILIYSSEGVADFIPQDILICCDLFLDCRTQPILGSQVVLGTGCLPSDARRHQKLRLLTGPQTLPKGAPEGFEIAGIVWNSPLVLQWLLLLTTVAAKRQSAWPLERQARSLALFQMIATSVQTSKKPNLLRITGQTKARKLGYRWLQCSFSFACWWFLKVACCLFISLSPEARTSSTRRKVQRNSIVRVLL